MLNQGKRKRTVEDFNQFCSFVLAYAGYIPYPNEDWRCNARVRGDSSPGGPPCCEDSVSHSAPQSYSSPSQSERAYEVKLEEEKLGTTVNKEKGKKRKGEKRNVLDKGRRANKRIPDAGGGMKSFGTKKPTEDPCPQKHKFEMADGASVCRSLGVVGPISASDSNDGKGAVMGQPLPEDFVDMYGDNTRLSALKRHPQEHTGNVDCAISSQDTQTGWGHLKIFGGARVNMWCNDIREWPKGDHGKNGLRSEQEVKAEPVDLSMLSRTGLVQNAVVIPQENEKVERAFGGTAVDGSRNVKDLEGSEGRGSLLGKETWGDREGEAVDIMRLVMEQRLTGNVPDDQETGYHTDWASSTPEQGGSDTDQDTHATDGNTTISSAYDTEDASAENGVLEGEDDSWDLITCFCMKPFAGRPMIECGECGTWVHLSCAKIRRTHVPDVFVCQPCRDAKQNIRRSGRARTASRKRFGD